MTDRALVLFTKPARPGEVKTRLIGTLSPQEAAALHAAFRDDLVERLETGAFDLRVSWALAEGEDVPEGRLVGERQVEGDLGDRLFEALTSAGARAGRVAAVGSDHPLLTSDLVNEAFDRLGGPAEIVFGPATDGGYYLVAARANALKRRVFEEIAWSSSAVLEQTLERCHECGLQVELLPEASDVDTPEDLRVLCEALIDSPTPCPRTRRLLSQWGRMSPVRG